MDKVESAADIIMSLNRYHDGDLKDYELIKQICTHFDRVKYTKITPTEKELLYHIASQIGIPHYFDTLSKFNQDVNISYFNTNTFVNLLRESALHTSKDIKLHRYQKEILDLFQRDKINRYFLSASTSFGKTYLVYEIIRKMRYNNILLIFPTIALLSENLEKIYSNPSYKWIEKSYKIHTLSKIKHEEYGEKNIFIFTPERYLSFIDRNSQVTMNFFFVDEVYKIDNDYIVDEISLENERDVAYRLAIYYALRYNLQIDTLFAGPYIDFSLESDSNYNSSFDSFLRKYNITLLDYNTCEMVIKTFLDIKSKNAYSIENYDFNFKNRKKKNERFQIIIREILCKKDNVIVYCSTRSQTEKYAKHIIKDSGFEGIDISKFRAFYNHLCAVFKNSKNWVLVKALRKGIGIHHGLIPKYIQKEIINLFNNGYLKILISTTTITEGVNTNAKNMLTLSHMKGNKQLKKFDALNIAGRAGRFLQHFRGNLITLDSEFLKIKDEQADAIKHKYFDDESPKSEVDIYHTNEAYLNDNDIKIKQEIDSLVHQCNIPQDILNQYKVISIKDKILMYNRIQNCTPDEILNIQNMIKYYQSNKNITFQGIEVIIKIVLPSVKNKKLKWMMETYPKDGRTNYILTLLLYTYLKNGFKGMVEYKYSQDRNIDKAINDTADFVYNTLKYHTVKYLGVFNLMYKYFIANKNSINIDDVKGLDSILLKLEYNANTDEARVASDYGVSQKILEFYDTDELENRQQIQDSFDDYELSLFDKVENILKQK